ncbi:hypothetical protein [Butyrivibrio sp. LB2008]|uniref:hypothetical protein n=1 Tax=Butyrivibrio sp. LB2008 TaxID=1408305 RepID=UPI00047E4DA1|nr:hypothetical protein [Butyrivibrio sp. LB2008]
MKEKKILLISFDKEYVDNILSELPFVLNDSSELIVISNEEYYVEYCKQSHPKVDVLIVDENISRESLFSQPADTTYYLVENTEEKNTISKYDAADGIVNKLGEDYAITMQDDAGKTKVIDVCAASGGCGKTKAAIGIAARLSQMGYDVLYVDAEEVQNFYEFFPDSLKSDWAESALAIAFMNGGAPDVLIKGIRKLALDYVPAFKEPLYAYNISLQAYYDMINEIAGREIYDYIVVEHVAGLTKELAKYLSDSKMIAMCTNDIAGEPKRVRKFIGNIAGFVGQCVVICNSDEAGADADINIKSDEYRYPVCEMVAFDRKTVLDAAKLIDGNRYLATVIAVK